MDTKFNDMTTREKIILITGATSGIGKATAEALAKQGATIVIFARNKQKAEMVITELKSKTGNQDISYIEADLASLDSVRKAVAEFKSKFNKLDVLINNAAVNLFSRQITVDGFEENFAVNHLGHFLLTHLLLDKLRAVRSARIINVTSSAQAALDFNDLMSEKEYNVMKVYSKTKMANVLFTYELSRRLNNTSITVNCLHPGVVKTKLARDAKGLFKILIFLFYPFFSSPEKGAETSIYLATSPEVEGITGKYFHKKKQINSSPESYDKNVAQKLWNVSEQLTGLI